MFWSPKIIKFESEAAVISGIKSFQTPLLLAVILILISSCEDMYKIFVLTVEYKENEQLKVFLLVQTLKEEAELVSSN